MKKAIFLFSFLLPACLFLPPTPNDFPPPPATVIVEFPNVTVTPIVEMRPRPVMQSDMSDAQTFLLIIKTQIAAGDYYGFAEKVHYPINVDSEGKMKAFTTPDEFARNIDSILTDNILKALVESNEEDLLLLPEGIRVGHGELWLNLFCVDAACADVQFLITQINN